MFKLAHNFWSKSTRALNDTEGELKKSDKKVLKYKEKSDTEEEEEDDEIEDELLDLTMEEVISTPEDIIDLTEIFAERRVRIQLMFSCTLFYFFLQSLNSEN